MVLVVRTVRKIIPHLKSYVKYSFKNRRAVANIWTLTEDSDGAKTNIMRHIYIYTIDIIYFTHVTIHPGLNSSSDFLSKCKDELNPQCEKVIVRPIFLQMGPQEEHWYIQQGLRSDDHAHRKNTLCILPNCVGRISI